MYEFFFRYLGAFWGTLVYVVSVVVSAWLMSRMIRWVIYRIILITKGATNRTALLFIRSSVKVIIGTLAVFYIIYTVPAFRQKALFILSGAGLFAAVLGFVAQSALSNLVSGLFIVIFKPFRVGDYIKLDADRLGIVTDITLRHTVINNFENKRLIIPNSIISRESILNHTIEDSQILSFNNFMLGLYADIDKAKQIIIEEAKKLPDYIDRSDHVENPGDGEPVRVQVIKIDDAVIHLRAYVWINGPTNEFRNKAILRENVHKRFVKEGIDLPIKIRKVIRMEG